MQHDPHAVPAFVILTKVRIQGNHRLPFVAPGPDFCQNGEAGLAGRRLHV
jgi:hypothetical protein